MGCVAIGLWMLIDKKISQPLQIFKRKPDDRHLLAAPAVLLTAGIIIIGMGVLAMFGYMRNSRKLLTLYGGLLFIVMLFELVVGFMAVHFEDEIHLYVKKGMKISIREYYEYENNVGKAWNWVQVRYKCCGADFSSDYQNSKWFVRVNKGNNINQNKQYVPRTCCSLAQNEDPRKADTQNPNIINFRRCQDEAFGQQQGGASLNNNGCFAQLLNRMERIITALMTLGLIVGLCQVFGLLSVYVVVKQLNSKKA
ncbi:DgyrCDS7666 [Dimorphilus gyrociliatus]|uniref:Tetraspanin n=1 Tax=Dimorphilus gyrociliatus TaxID=2664684 RepID=A0A7I8VUB7_9ANNE|nr:DgyrCDS7666 [Dimorphilus gyrociliatus]